MEDKTEGIRRGMMAEVKDDSRTMLEGKFGEVWDSDTLSKDFTVKGFMAPFVVVERKSDNKMGSLKFQPSPRFYHSFQEDK